MLCDHFEIPAERAKELAEHEKRKAEGLEYTISSLEKEIRKLKKDRNKLTRLLCEAGQAIESGDVEDLVSEQFLKWYADHKRRDALRKKKKI